MLHVVLLDNRRLRILRRDPDDALIEMYAVEDPEAVAHERDLRADRPGRTVNAASGSRVALQPKHSARSISLQRWLKTVGMKLSAFLAEGQSDGLVLVASARLLGLLKAALPTEVRRSHQRRPRLQ
jgi:protein required for attachment to host cells